MQTYSSPQQLVFTYFLLDIDWLSKTKHLENQKYP